MQNGRENDMTDIDRIARRVYDYIELQFDEDPTYETIEAGVEKIITALREYGEAERLAGFAVAREKAVQIAGELEWKDFGDDNCLEITERIRAMEMNK